MEGTDLTGRLIASRYQLTRRIGQGGMGEVYETADGARRLALKIMRADRVDGEFFARFIREATLTKRLFHPHVVSTLDVGVDPVLGAPYILMPLLTGRDLGQVLAQTGALAPEVACRIARQACAGLSAVHDAGIVHRDIKPTNLFLESRADGEVSVRLMDFGIAKRIDAASTASLTQTGKALGSPQYMSPEQIKSSKHVDLRTDVFSLGVVLYEMLSGRLPWEDATTLGELMIAICTRQAPDLRERAGWIEPALEACVMRALERDPAYRYASASELAHALGRWTRGEDRVFVQMLAPVPDDTRFKALRGSTRHAQADAPTEHAPAGDALLGRRLGGRYRLVRLIGRGGMGSVYEAQTADGQRFATKLISAEAAGKNEQALRRFVREARAARAIQSPHVVQSFELDVDHELGIPFLVMELLTGSDLADLVEQRAPLEPVPAVRLFVQAARGLAAAHARGIVHRDIKPANLYLHRAGASDRITVKICDFGIAKPTQLGDEHSQDLTRTGGILGSPVYMSPEQAKNAKKVDPRSDLFSLSVSLHEALSGRRPWKQHTSLGEIIVAICTETLPSLREIAPWIDPALARVVQRGLARHPDARWQSADQLIEALSPFSGGTEVVDLSLLSRADAGRRPAVNVPLELPPANETTLDPPTTIAASVQPIIAAEIRPSRSKGARAFLLGAAALAAIGAGVVLTRQHLVIPAGAPGTASSATVPAFALPSSERAPAPPERAPPAPIASAAPAPSPAPQASTEAARPAAPAVRASTLGRTPASKPQATRTNPDKPTKRPASADASSSKSTSAGMVTPKDEWQ